MSEPKCPLTGDPCWEHGCKFYTQLMGKHPQTGADIAEWNCAIAFLPMLLIENAQQSRQTGAAVESFRNEMVKSNVAALEARAQNLEQLQRRLAGQNGGGAHAPGNNALPSIDG